MKCVCPNCKTKFDITEVVEPIRRKAIEDFTKKIIEVIYGKESDKA